MKRLLILMLLLLVQITYAENYYVISGTTHNSNYPNVYSNVDIHLYNNESTYLNSSKSNSTAGYSLTTYANISDMVYIWAYNSTKYGEVILNLTGDTSNVDVYLNKTRPSETNTTITSPTTSKVEFSQFTINATIQNIGETLGTSCTSDIVFNSSNIYLNDGSESNSLGNIASKSSTTTYWNITTNSSGDYLVTVNSSCTNDFFFKFENLTIDNLVLTITSDTTPPVVNLVDPINVTTLKSQTHTFTYDVSDDASIANCSLYFNNTINQTDFSVTQNTNQTFTTTLANGNYDWNVTCYDNRSNQHSQKRLVIIDYYFYINNLLLDDFDGLLNGLDLTAGTTTLLNCSGNVEYSYDSITSLIAKLYDKTNSNSESSDDNAKHYSNNSCSLTTIDSDTSSFNCLFNVYFFANSGTWECNVTAQITENTSNVTTATMNELLAIDIHENSIDFGNLEINQNTGTTDYTSLIKNNGNVMFNVTTKAYAVTEEDGSAMQCTQNNISIENLKYSTTASTVYSSKIASSQDGNNISINLNKQTNGAVTIPTNTTIYWGFGIPISPVVSGTCNGSLNILAIQG